jgi:hypothetical protein
MTNNLIFFLVPGLFLLILNLINPDNMIPVFAAVIVGTEEADEIKGTSKKDSLYGLEERDKLWGQKCIRLY